MKKVILTPVFHREKNCIKIAFKRDPALENLVRTIGGCRWSTTLKSWYVPERNRIISDLFNTFKSEAYVDYEAFKLKKNVVNEVPILDEEKNCVVEQKFLENNLPDEKSELVERFKHWMLSRRYSSSTISTYTEALGVFLKYFYNKSVSEISNQDIITFNNRYILANKLSASYQNQIINAIKLFFKTIENKTVEVDLIHRPKRQKLIPNVLSKEEIKGILSASSNLKHRAMLSLVYSCGLRRGELLKLTLNDIDSKRGLIIIRQSKGRKDRIAPLSKKVLVLLREYYLAYKPKRWLFEGQNGDGPYDERSLQNVLKQAVKKAGINKPVSMHWLRHSYATHLLESGTDLRYIQELLGHSSSRTTEIYTHVSNKSIQSIVSPFDSL